MSQFGDDPKAHAAAAKAYAKAQRPWFKKKRFILPLVLLVLIVIGAAAGGGGDDDDDGGQVSQAVVDDGAAGTTAPPAQSGEDTYAIGQTARTDTFEVVVHAVEDPMVGEDTGGTANRYVAVEAEVRNVGDERATLSTLVGAELIDSLNRTYTPALVGFDRPQLDGDVPAGSARRGWVAFEVPTDATGLHFRLKGSLTAQGALFVLG